MLMKFSSGALSRAGLIRAWPSFTQRVARPSPVADPRQTATWRSGQGLGGWIRSRAVETSAGPSGDEITKLLWELPPDLSARVSIALWDLKEQVLAMAVKLAAKSDKLAAKSDKLAAKTEELHRTKQSLSRALYAAGVVNARTLLEYVVMQWEEELFCSVGRVKRHKVFKAGLRKRKELVKCLRRDVPTWVHAGMDEEQMVEDMAKNLEAVMLDASNNIHTFHPVIGLTLLKTGHSAPTVAALACLADSMGVLCHIMEVKTMGDQRDENDNDVTSV
ncbi:hypothetical protein CHLRE_08g383750v5 [Chlamydomonas reinhardtii]|uniref:Uncharacterized protein n=1 Tax=Chlamydomonas reinhardtii TaxID=3055 RepID=A0A2K3DI94_CHLRE|nr:uncharacterized protein CHLRE_08g383750v5 [Chlamydomonas reinhardtii]PNW80245.1 hypothetical protein CHLRE_08g383750v5 [Chlamydomonas reinhardtii]